METKDQSSKNSKDNVNNIEINSGDQKKSDNLNDKDTRHSKGSSNKENDKTISRPDSSQKLGDLWKKAFIKIYRYAWIFMLCMVYEFF